MDPESSSKAETEPETARPHTVLVVDDEPAVAEVTGEHLAALGYTVLTTSDPYDAIRRASSQPVDLLITDVVMPIMRGTELARRIQGASPATKIVLMSGYVVAEAIASGLPLVIKPFTMDRLADAVRDVLESASPAPRRLATLAR